VKFRIAHMQGNRHSAKQLLTKRHGTDIFLHSKKLLTQNFVNPGSFYCCRIAHKTLKDIWLRNQLLFIDHLKRYFCKFLSFTAAVTLARSQPLNKIDQEFWQRRGKTWDIRF